MSYQGNVFRATGLAFGAVMLLAGCGPGDNDSSKGTTSTPGPSLAADVPRSYDPCKDVPESVLAAEKLHGRDLANLDADSPYGRIKWQGCAWVRSNGYAASIRTTNLTIDVVRSRNYADTREFMVNGRRAISTRQFDGPHIMEACTLDVEMKGGGSLEFGVNNPPSRSETGTVDSCEIARMLAEKVVPTMPTTA
ncbi:DUF3558 family protein [Nocardia sp. R7R-8]|uniref:DUF3558 family protein n=1 Tax=Nocardia sp. R7R-8 TaxID=3459304 RepID=UPI00403E2532